MLGTALLSALILAAPQAKAAPARTAPPPPRDAAELVHLSQSLQDLSQRVAPSVVQVLTTGYTGGSDGTGPGPAASLQDHEIADRLVDAMVDEAARLLADGGADSAVTIDLAMVMGAGYPAFRGGLIRHADRIGLSVIADRLESRGLKPAALLRTRGRFYG